MFVAVCDQSTGTSTSRCSKMTEPLSLPIEAVRVSHWTSSYGVLPASSLAVKCRGNAIPVLIFLVDLVFNNSILALKSTEICPIAVFSFGNPTDNCHRNGAPIYGVTSRSLSICSVLELRLLRPKDYRSVTESPSRGRFHPRFDGRLVKPVKSAACGRDFLGSQYHQLDLASLSSSRSRQVPLGYLQRHRAGHRDHVILAHSADKLVRRPRLQLV